MVFPAGAGVILQIDQAKPADYRFPRRCGGDPVTFQLNAVNNQFAPQGRG